MVLSKKVEAYEQLYRVVKRSKPEHISIEKRISSALFKDDSGVSVDRDGSRPESEIIEFIKNSTFQKRTKGVVSFTAQFCFDIGADVEPAPSEIDPYHANVFLDKENEKNRNLQALKLADACKLVYYDDEMEWT